MRERVGVPRRLSRPSSFTPGVRPEPRTGTILNSDTTMNYVEVAGIFLNLDHVTFIREEEHPHLGLVLAIHLAPTGSDPLFVGTQHHDDLRRLLAERGEGASLAQS
jgi:hypothetical protein